MTEGMTFTTKVHFGRASKRKELRAGAKPPETVMGAGRVPRVARLGHVTRARVSQIMNLLNLAPDIQDEILLLRMEAGKDRITERLVRRIVANLEWKTQRRCWEEFR